MEGKPLYRGAQKRAWDAGEGRDPSLFVRKWIKPRPFDFDNPVNCSREQPINNKKWNAPVIDFLTGAAL